MSIVRSVFRPAFRPAVAGAFDVLGGVGDIGPLPLRITSASFTADSAQPGSGVVFRALFAGLNVGNNALSVDLTHTSHLSGPSGAQSIVVVGDAGGGGSYDFAFTAEGERLLSAAFVGDTVADGAETVFRTQWAGFDPGPRSVTVDMNATTDLSGPRGQQTFGLVANLDGSAVLDITYTGNPA